MRLILAILLTATTMEGATRFHVQGVARQGATVWLATFGHGLLRSDDGMTFSAAALPEDVTRVLAVVSNGESVIAGTEGLGVWRSQDEGRAWARWDDGLPEFVSTEALLAEPNGTLWAGTTDHGLFVRRARDEKWTKVKGFTSTAGISSLLLHGRTTLAATVGDGLYVSNDEGESWTKANGFSPDATIAALTSYGGGVLACTSEGVLFAADDGLHFRLLSRTTLCDVYAITAGQRGLYASANNGVFASMDGGAHWSRIAAPDELPFAGRLFWQDDEGRVRLTGARNSIDQSERPR